MTQGICYLSMDIQSLSSNLSMHPARHKSRVGHRLELGYPKRVLILNVIQIDLEVHLDPSNASRLPCVDMQVQSLEIRK